VRRALALLLLAWPGVALADTPCPMVSDGVSILTVNVVNAPWPVANASYDMETHYLTVTFTDRRSRMFVGVPLGIVQGIQTQWANFSAFPQAIMQEWSTCPLLTQNDLPILTPNQRW
jgi:hypothetical protein